MATKQGELPVHRVVVVGSGGTSALTLRFMYDEVHQYPYFIVHVTLGTLVSLHHCSCIMRYISILTSLLCIMRYITSLLCIMRYISLVPRPG